MASHEISSIVFLWGRGLLFGLCQLLLVAGSGAVLFAWAGRFPCLREDGGVSIPEGTLLSESVAPWLELRGRPCTTLFNVTISGEQKKQFMSLPMIA